MNPMKFCSPEIAYPIWKAMILPALGYFFPKLCLWALCNPQIFFHCSDSGTALHKSSISLVASGVNSPFSILLSLSWSWGFTGWDRRCISNHLFMLCLTLTHGSSLEWSRMGGILTSAWKSKTRDFPFKFWAIWRNTLSNREQFISKIKILKTVWIISLCIPFTHLTK